MSTRTGSPPGNGGPLRYRSGPYQAADLEAAVGAKEEGLEEIDRPAVAHEHARRGVGRRQTHAFKGARLKLLEAVRAAHRHPLQSAVASDRDVENHDRLEHVGQRVGEQV